MKRRRSYFAALIAMALLAAACGSSSDDNSGSTSGTDSTEAAGSEEAGGVDEDAAKEQLAQETTTTAVEDAMEAATSIEELEEQWAARRAEIVQKINDGGYGVDENNVLTGPGGFEIDLNECPSDWDDTEGVGDTIKIGHSTAQSGNVAIYGNIANGWQVYLDYVNENGGVAGKDVELIVKDDAYVATQTIEVVDEFLQSDKPLAIVTLGSPNSLAVYDKLNESCVPHPYAMTGHPAWGDPVNHPWTSGYQMSYATEAILWGAWIEQNLADELPVTVAGLVMDNDFGLAYEDGMKRYMEANPDVVKEFVPVRHDPAGATVTNEMTTINAAEPDVFIAMTGTVFCTLAMQDAANNGMADTMDAGFMPSVCKGVEGFMTPAGDAAEGYYIVGGGVKISTDPLYKDEPFFVFSKERLEAAGLDPTVDLYTEGFGRGWAFVETLRIAAELDGGLTRPNFMLALRSLDLEHPMYIDGITFAVNGAEDAYFVEGSDIARFDVADQSWVPQGAVVDLNGSSANCTWGDNGCG